MLLANVGVLPAGAPELGVVYKYVLPLVRGSGPGAACIADGGSALLMLTDLRCMAVGNPSPLVRCQPEAHAHGNRAPAARLLPGLSNHSPGLTPGLGAAAARALFGGCRLAGASSVALALLYALRPSTWLQVVAALTARHIGGAVNYMAVSETLGLSPSVFGAGLAGGLLPPSLCTLTLHGPHDQAGWLLPTPCSGRPYPHLLLQRHLCPGQGYPP